MIFFNVYFLWSVWLSLFLRYFNINLIFLKKSKLFSREGPKKEKQLFDQRENYRMKKVLNTRITASSEEFL